MDKNQIDADFRNLVIKYINKNFSEWGGINRAAEKFGIDASTLSNVLAGRRTLSEKKRIEILEEIGGYIPFIAGDRVEIPGTDKTEGKDLNQDLLNMVISQAKHIKELELKIEKLETQLYPQNGESTVSP